MFSRGFSWIFQNSYSKISVWFPLGQLLIFLDILVFHFKGLNIQNVLTNILSFFNKTSYSNNLY